MCLVRHVFAEKPRFCRQFLRKLSIIAASSLLHAYGHQHTATMAIPRI
jgi:hypothetical protein